MIPQIKSVFIGMLLLSPFLTHAQEQEQVPEGAMADSLQEVYTRQLNNRLYRMENSLLQRIGEQQEMIDSLVGRSGMLEQDISELEAGQLEIQLQQLEMQLQQQETEQLAIMNKHILFGEKERFRRILYIAGPSLLGLILISTVLFFVLFMRQTEQTDRKIMALRKYTHSEVDETRDELLIRFKKRVRKLRDRMEQRMLKKERKEKKSRLVAKTKKSKQNRK